MQNLKDKPFYQLFENMNDPAVLIKKGVYFDCNSAALKLLGLSEKGDLLGCSPAKFSPPFQTNGQSSAERESEVLAHCIKERSFQFEWQHLRPDDSIVNLEVVSMLVTFGEDSIIFSVCRDLSGREQINEILRKSEKRLRAFHEASMDAWMLLGKTGFIECNQVTVSLFGCKSEAHFCSFNPAIVSPDQQPCGTSSMELAGEYVAKANRDGSCQFEWLHRRVDTGETFYSDVLLTSMVIDGEVVIQGNVRDITDRKRSEHYEIFRTNVLQQIASDASLDSVLESIALGVEQFEPSALSCILLLDATGNHLEVGAAPSIPSFYITAINGAEIGPDVGGCGAAAYSGQRVILESIEHEAPEFLYKDLAAEAGLVACWSEPILAGSGQIIAILATYYRESYVPSESDINFTEETAQLVKIAIERKRMEEKMQQLAFEDALTGLSNRRTLEARLGHAVISNARSNKRGALLFIDLDNFKEINDSLGHAIGDLLLKQVGQRLLTCVRQGDTVARFGGDEFVLMLEDLTDDEVAAAAQAENIGEKVLRTLGRAYQFNNSKYYNSPSIGVVLFDGHEPVGSLLQQADIAMYQAKLAGRNTIRFFNPEMQKAVDIRMLLEKELRRALKYEQFLLHYQPQVDDKGEVVGVEALVRWLHPERGLVSPIEFISLAEETNLITPIGEWVLNTACSQIKRWEENAKTRELVLSINISAKQFAEKNFVDQVLTAIQLYNINPNLLNLELTESVLVINIDEVFSSMKRLKQLGVRLSLDDFGTGYSSLQYLKALPLDQLKIDQSFVKELPKNKYDQSIVRTIITMAKGLDLDVIAEGVETAEQREILLDFGCVHCQGYLFAKPMPLEAFEMLPELV